MKEELELSVGYEPQTFSCKELRSTTRAHEHGLFPKQNCPPVGRWLAPVMRHGHGFLACRRVSCCSQKNVYASTSNAACGCSTAVEHMACDREVGGSGAGLFLFSISSVVRP